ncbi:MAG: helix-turn-helix transcriptional regulator [Sulfolobaceae archaeon]
MYNEYTTYEKLAVEESEGTFYEQKLIIARESKGLTLKEAADLLEVHYQTLQKWENGINVPSVKYFFKIAKLYEVPMCEFFI